MNFAIKPNANAARARRAVAQSLEHFMGKRHEAETLRQAAEAARYDAIMANGFDTYMGMLSRA